MQPLTHKVEAATPLLAPRPVVLSLAALVVAARLSWPVAPSGRRKAALLLAVSLVELTHGPASRLVEPRLLVWLVPLTPSCICVRVGLAVVVSVVPPRSWPTLSLVVQ